MRTGLEVRDGRLHVPAEPGVGLRWDERGRPRARLNRQAACAP
ncbi:hypothetical protein DSM104299_01829 [Baekduia alba]|nr:hypothetical protein DSM104299_01829 [Baekduia alba]